jgi:NAD(P)-dependent dehydrogenase (short-subunit alcohol dehydrogenase family)
MLLAGKSAVIYGAGGAVGGAVARAFASEGATVFLAGRTLAPLESVTREIIRAGGKAEAAQVDALDGNAVESHLLQVVKKAGKLDVSFNLIRLGEDFQGSPLTEMSQERFSQPIVTAMKTHFLTATAVARHMAKGGGGGAILALTAVVSRRYEPNVGGFGVAGAAIEGFCRQLAGEVGTQGIRVVCLRSSGSPDAPGVDEVFRLHAENAGISREAFEAGLAERSAMKRLPKLAEVADVAVMMASDKASAVTGAVVNVNCGEIVD